MESKTVKIDYAKLTADLQAKNKTNVWLSLQLGRDKYFVSHLKQNPEKPEAIENLICMILGVEKGTFVLPELKEEPKPQGEITVLNNLHKDVKSLLAVMENVASNQEKMWNKLNANTVQLERIKDCVKRFEKSEHEIACDFLKDALADGKANGEEVLMRSDAAGIKRADLMKAKNTIGIDTQTTGYGKNQKTWWMLDK